MIFRRIFTIDWMQEEQKAVKKLLFCSHLKRPLAKRSNDHSTSSSPFILSHDRRSMKIHQTQRATRTAQDNSFPRAGWWSRYIPQRKLFTKHKTPRPPAQHRKTLVYYITHTAIPSNPPKHRAVFAVDVLGSTATAKYAALAFSACRP